MTPQCGNSLLQEKALNKCTEGVKSMLCYWCVHMFVVFKAVMCLIFFYELMFYMCKLTAVRCVLQHRGALRTSRPSRPSLPHSPAALMKTRHSLSTRKTTNLLSFFIFYLPFFSDKPAAESSRRDALGPCSWRVLDSPGEFRRVLKVLDSPGKSSRVL